MGGLVLAGNTSGSTTIQATDAVTATITLPSATGTLVAAGGALGTPTSGTLTNCVGLPATTGITGTLPVANGGTGAATLAANNVLLGNGTGAVQAVAPSTSGNVLTSNGSTWTSAAPPSSGGFVFISTTSLIGLSTLTISGLTLTSYQQLYLYVDSFSPTAASVALRINGVNEVSMVSATNTFSASWLIDLNTGINLAASALIDTTLTSVAVPNTPYTTLIKKASTSFTISVVNSGTFDSGSISIYGVK